jgi:hypothetical protein
VSCRVDASVRLQRGAVLQAKRSSDAVMIKLIAVVSIDTSILVDCDACAPIQQGGYLNTGISYVRCPASHG